MSRNFPDFLKAYEDYSQDGFCPPQFHRWIGISLIAAALERKVSLKQGKINHHPNLFVMLVSHPAVGKSTAIDTGMDLIETLKKDHDQNFRIIPNQATEPALIDMMKIIDRIQISPTVTYPHSSAYFYASEASASALQNTCGDFVASMTAFYDCPKWFRKKLKGDPYPTEIENSCMNLLAGSTFDYLKNLVNETSIMGGFASRLIYVVSREREVKKTKWGAGEYHDPKMRSKLLADLIDIHKMIGPMTVTPGWISRYEKWRPEFDQFLIDLDSPKMESINARKGTHLIKLSMIMSISEGNEMIVTEKHFDQAQELIEAVTKENPMILRSAVIADKTSQSGINQLLASLVAKHGGVMNHAQLKREVMSNGNPIPDVVATLNYMISSGIFQLEGADTIRLTVNPDRYL